MTRKTIAVPAQVAPIGAFLCRASAVALVAATLASCNGLSYAQRNSPANAYKDYKTENQKQNAVIGMGEPITARQMTANATITLNGQYNLAEVMARVAGTYNTAIRWGNGTRRDKRMDVVLNNLSFDEARNYLEDVYDVQIIKEGERRLLVLPSASEPRLTSFNPGMNVSLSQAIRGLAEQCNYNIVINENREQLNRIRVTANLKNVTCYDAFDALLNPHGLSLTNNGDYMTIGGLPQRQWTLNLYEPQRTEEVEVNYASDFASASGGEGESSSGGGTTSAGGSTKVTVKYDRDLWKDLEADLNELIQNGCPSPLDSGSTVRNEPSLLPPPTGEGSREATEDMSSTSSESDSSSSTSESGTSSCGYVRINSAVGMIQMRAPRDILDEADEIIQRVQDVASRRLLLEARVLAVSRGRNYDQQANLAFGGAKGGDGRVVTSGAFKGSVTSALSGVLANLSPGGGLDSAGGLVIKSNNLDAVMALLENYGTTYELMHPMMELMDRQRATLIDGRNEKYFVLKADTSTSTSGATTSYDVEERNQFLGLQFSATAQISDNPAEPHTVSLQIPITSLAKTIEIPSGGVSSSSAGTAPVANTRLIDQKVRVRDGEIKVIGGLTKTIAVDTESGVPLIRDIPALGKLANQESIQYENVEFVILLQVRRLY